MTDYPHIEMFTRAYAAARTRFVADGPLVVRARSHRGDRGRTDQFGELVASRALAERRPPAGAEDGARPLLDRPQDRRRRHHPHVRPGGRHDPAGSTSAAAADDVGRDPGIEVDVLASRKRCSRVASQ